MLRIGYGYDLHRMTDGDFITLGGINISCGKKMIAHSDGDVLVHAIMDALLGAAALGDIGDNFPDTDASYKGIDSMILLKRVQNMIEEKGYRIINIDSTVLAEYPKLKELKRQMSDRISEVLNIPADCVSVKASTQEKTGCTKNAEAVIAHAICLLEKNNTKRGGL